LWALLTLTMPESAFHVGYIRRAELFQQKFWFVEPDHLRRNISYALILDDVHRWIISRTDLAGVAQEMVLKDSLVLLGNIAEVLTQVPLTTSADQKKDFRKRLSLLMQKGAIDSELSAELSGSGTPALPVSTSLKLRYANSRTTALRTTTWGGHFGKAGVQAFTYFQAAQARWM
jgi:hypothetical protein